VSARWLLVTLLALSACAERAEPGAGSDPDQPVTNPPVTTVPNPGPTTLEVEPREGLVDVVPHIWDKAEPLDSTTVRVEFYGGVEECEGLDRVEVEETKDTVTITLYIGRVPSAEVCIEIALLKATTVELDSPLGGREIVDGAARA
jgi:hypothetical protein